MGEVGETGDVLEQQQEKSSIPEHKAELINRAMGEVDSVYQGGREVNYANREFKESVGSSVSRLRSVATNGDPREDGFRQIEDLHDRIRGMRSSLFQIDEILDRSHLPPYVNEEIEKQLILLASQTEEEEKQESSHEATSLFNGVVGRIYNMTEELQSTRRRGVITSNENEEEARRLTHRHHSELTQGYLRQSRRLSETAHNSDSKTRGVERDVKEDNAQRQSRFNRFVSEIGEPSLPENINSISEG